MPIQTSINVATPAVLMNQYPWFDSAGNRMQRIRLRFICGHEEEFGLLDLGKGWKPRTNRQLMDDHLRITCPIAWKICGHCARNAETVARLEATKP